MTSPDQSELSLKLHSEGEITIVREVDDKFYAVCTLANDGTFEANTSEVHVSIFNQNTNATTAMYYMDRDNTVDGVTYKSIRSLFLEAGKAFGVTESTVKYDGTHSDVKTIKFALPLGYVKSKTYYVQVKEFLRSPTGQSNEAIIGTVEFTVDSTPEPPITNVVSTGDHDTVKIHSSGKVHSVASPSVNHEGYATDSRNITLSVTLPEGNGGSEFKSCTLTLVYKSYVRNTTNSTLPFAKKFVPTHKSLRIPLGVSTAVGNDGEQRIISTKPGTSFLVKWPAAYGSVHNISSPAYATSGTNANKLEVTLSANDISSYGVNSRVNLIKMNTNNANIFSRELRDVKVIAISGNKLTLDATASTLSNASVTLGDLNRIQLFNPDGVSLAAVDDSIICCGTLDNVGYEKDSLPSNVSKISNSTKVILPGEFTMKYAADVLTGVEVTFDPAFVASENLPDEDDNIFYSILAREQAIPGPTGIVTQNAWKTTDVRNKEFTTVNSPRVFTVKQIYDGGQLVDLIENRVYEFALIGDDNPTGESDSVIVDTGSTQRSPNQSDLSSIKRNFLLSYATANVQIPQLGYNQVLLSNQNLILTMGTNSFNVTPPTFTPSSQNTNQINNLTYGWNLYGKIKGGTGTNSEVLLKGNVFQSNTKVPNEIQGPSSQLRTFDVVVSKNNVDVSSYESYRLSCQPIVPVSNLVKNFVQSLGLPANPGGLFLIPQLSGFMYQPVGSPASITFTRPVDASIIPLPSFLTNYMGSKTNPNLLVNVITDMKKFTDNLLTAKSITFEVSSNHQFDTKFFISSSTNTTLNPPTQSLQIDSNGGDNVELVPLYLYLNTGTTTAPTYQLQSLLGSANQETLFVRARYAVTQPNITTVSLGNWSDPVPFSSAENLYEGLASHNVVASVAGTGSSSVLTFTISHTYPAAIDWPTGYKISGMKSVVLDPESGSIVAEKFEPFNPKLVTTQVRTATIALSAFKYSTVGYSIMSNVVYVAIDSASNAIPLNSTKSISTVSVPENVSIKRILVQRAPGSPSITDTSTVIRSDDTSRNASGSFEDLVKNNQSGGFITVTVQVATPDQAEVFLVCPNGNNITTTGSPVPNDLVLKMTRYLTTDIFQVNVIRKPGQKDYSSITVYTKSLTGNNITDLRAVNLS